MPRYAIFSDVHGNAEALDAFVEHSRRQAVEGYLCCGDIVGYGADPGYCLDRVLQLCTSPSNPSQTIIVGNHDAAVVQGSVRNMNPHAARAVLWSRDQLAPQQIQQLAALPLTSEIGSDLLLVHGAPYSPSAWNYILDLADMQRAVDHFDHTLCCVGHTHVPFFVEVLSGLNPIVLTRSKILMQHSARYLVNVGSIGQPRDNDPRGCYVIYDLEQQTLERYRFEYDIEEAQRKIIEAGLPPILAERLAVGF